MQVLATTHPFEALPTGGTRRRLFHRSWFLPSLFGLLAAAITNLGSWIPSLWGDEAATSLSAQRSFASLWHELGHVDAVYGLYYTFMHGWVKIFGSSPYSLRLPSALAAGATVAGLVVLCRLWQRGPLFAGTVAVVAIMLPRLSYAGQEARAYAADATAAVWLMVIVVATLRGILRSGVGWALYTVVLVLATYLFMYNALVALVVGALVWRWRGWHGRGARWGRSWLISTVVAAALCLPIVYEGWRERAQIAYLSTSNTSSLKSLVVGLWFSSTKVAIIDWILIAIAVLVWVGRLVWRSRVGARGQAPGHPAVESIGGGNPGADGNPVEGGRQISVEPEQGDRLSPVELCLWWLFLPSVLLVCSQLFFAGFTGRYLTFVAPAAAILVACGIREVTLLLAHVIPGVFAPSRSKRARTVIVMLPALVLLLAVVGISFPVFTSQRTPFAKNQSDWAQIATTIKALAKPGDDLAFDESNRPSRKPVLALSTYPNYFVGLNNVQMVSPYWKNNTWQNKMLSITTAVEEGRFTATRVWVVETAFGKTPHVTGLSALESVGYHIVSRTRLHSSEIVGMQR